MLKEESIIMNKLLNSTQTRHQYFEKKYPKIEKIKKTRRKMDEETWKQKDATNAASKTIANTNETA